MYEYAVNGSLDKCFKNNDVRALLPAATRLSIMFGVAKAVHFLHNEVRGWKVLHRDIKSANICLTEDFTPRLIDCGLATFVEKKHCSIPSETIIQSGSTVGPAIGTHMYMCPEYNSKKSSLMKCAYIPAYDVYSFGVVMAELILGRLNDGNSTNVFQTYVLNGEKPVVDGWKQLKTDGDIHASWNADALELVCKAAIGCITSSSKGRLSMETLLDLLKHASDLQDEETGVAPEDAIATLDEILLHIRKRNSELEGAGLGFCIHCDKMADCNRRPAVVTCSKGHSLCANCLDNGVEKAPASTTVTFKLSCLMDQCASQPFGYEDIKRHVRTTTWTFHWQKNNEQRHNEAMELQKDTKKVVDEINDWMKQWASNVDRRLSELASNTAIAERLNLCPALMVIKPSTINGRVNLITCCTNSMKQKYEVVFYCQRSLQPCHKPFEISVDRNWIVKAAPWLRIVIYIVAASEPTKVAEGIIKEFPLPAHTKEMKALIDELRINEKHDELQTLQGDALKAIGNIVNEKKNFEKWGNEMEYVKGENGRMIWVKKK